MNKIIQIQCPYDGTKLSVRYAPGIENKHITCPVCKNRYPFRLFISGGHHSQQAEGAQRGSSTQGDPSINGSHNGQNMQSAQHRQAPVTQMNPAFNPYSNTVLHDYNNGTNPAMKTVLADDGDETQFLQPDIKPGRLVIVGTGGFFQLMPGSNVIGRKSVKSSAPFQIDTGDRRALSREHIVIDVRQSLTAGFDHYVTLCKEQVNKTFIGNSRLMYGDRIRLSHGDIIHLPDVDLQFELSATAQEETQLYPRR